MPKVSPSDVLQLGLSVKCSSCWVLSNHSDAAHILMFTNNFDNTRNEPAQKLSAINFFPPHTFQFDRCFYPIRLDPCCFEKSFIFNKKSRIQCLSSFDHTSLRNTAIEHEKPDTFFWDVCWQIDYTFSFFKRIRHEFQQIFISLWQFCSPSHFIQNLQYWVALYKHGSTYEPIYVHLTLTGAMKWSSGCFIGQVTREFLGFQTHIEFIHHTQRNYL